MYGWFDDILIRLSHRNLFIWRQNRYNHQVLNYSALYTNSIILYKPFITSISITIYESFISLFLIHFGLTFLSLFVIYLCPTRLNTRIRTQQRSLKIALFLCAGWRKRRHMICTVVATTQRKPTVRSKKGTRKVPES